MKIVFAVFALLFLATISFAQTVDTAMIVTDMTNVDASIASAAASKAGMPVLVAEDGLLTDEIKSSLQSLGVKNVIIVGGPAVVKPSVEKELRSIGYNTVRLWGMERTGTAIAVARYLWTEDARCVVLVDDTKNSGADSRRHMAASNLASRFNCAFIPVPEGTVPSDVLALLKELNVSEVKFVGKRVYLNVQSVLAQFKLKEITGDDNEVENETEDDVVNETIRQRKLVKLVVVATPDWKAAVALSGHPNGRSVVRFVSDNSSVANIIDFVRAHNITNVRVVGLPDLAGQIAQQVQAAGINVTKISGPKAGAIAAETIQKTKTEWEERKGENDAIKARFRFKIRAYLERDLNETIDRLNAAEAELEALENSTENAEVKALIDRAQARIAEITSLIRSGSLDNATRLLADIRFSFNEKRFEYKDKLKIKIQNEVDDEEDTLDEQQSKTEQSLNSVESGLSGIRARCANSEIIDAIVAKAKSLRTSMQEAKASGNFTNASSHLVQVRELVRIAHSISEVCKQRGSLPGVVSSITERHEISGPPSIEIKSPKDGSTISGTTIRVEVDIDNFNLVPATNAPKAGEGHVHAFVDSIEQRGPKKTFVFENITAGSHTVKAELHLSDHTLVEGAVDSAAVTTVASTTSSGTSGSGTSGTSGGGY